MRFSHPECLYVTFRLSRLLTTFRINTCKSVSKQRTLTSFRINTYKKTGEGGTPANRWFRISNFPAYNSGNARHMLHVAPLSPAASLDCAYFPSQRGCHPLPSPTFGRLDLPTFKTSFHGILLMPIGG